MSTIQDELAKGNREAIEKEELRSAEGEGLRPAGGEGLRPAEGEVEKITLTKQELQDIISGSVHSAIKALAEESKKPEPRKLTVEEAKANAMNTVDTLGKGVLDCAKILGGGILGALDELFTAGVKIGLRATGRTK